MGQAVDLEQAAYHAIPADEAPVLGHAPPASAEGKSEGEGRALLIGFVASFALMMLTLWPFDYIKSANIPSFSVGLAGFDGIDPARPGPVVSPAFNLTLRMNKTCVDRAQLIVSYSGVALGWGHVEPGDCTSRQPWGKAVEIVAGADGVGLSTPLRQRLASEWRSGPVQLDVHVMVYNDNPRGVSAHDRVMMRCKVMTDGLQSESLPCAWYCLRPYHYGIIV
ncbi:hypothetical protein BRADI_2g51272v3 [Brachypodium distachyon]|uniref:Late embryogenesis abundant protein LEA-2 subgroup domain-containing protein n=1 Tax=Brachypodium distachyon TaxID=15368 RepID=A0A0Q3IWE0_BRADI|nr:hypothetical protein BRADI_2g51272v3 [Brachypodium distachyon]